MTPIILIVKEMCYNDDSYKLHIHFQMKTITLAELFNTNVT